MPTRSSAEWEWWAGAGAVAAVALPAAALVGPVEAAVAAVVVGEAAGETIRAVAAGAETSTRCR
jgi:hypothetical protein